MASMASFVRERENRNQADDVNTSKPNKQKAKPPGLATYWALAVLRILLTLIPQTGYIHPDEYFQTIEVIAGDAFDLQVERPWEFNVTFPIRSVLLPKIIYGFPYILLGSFTPVFNDILGWDIRTPYIMLVLPRLIACALSFVTDYCLYRICVLYGQKYRTCLLILATSYVPVIYGTRTLTNSLEMALMSYLLYLVADCMAVSTEVITREEFLDRKYSSATSPVARTKLFKMRAALPSHSLRRCFSMASLAVAGVFNRPTFFAFGLAPVFFWLQRGITSKYCGIRAFNLRIVLLSFCALPALFIFILTDSFYYGYLTWNEIGMGDISLKNFVVTPFNFLLYNSQEGNLAHHGLHPRVTHILVNIPILYNILGCTGILSLVKFLSRFSQGRWRELPRAESLKMLMTASLIIPVIVLSLAPHQEARFLIPITLPLVLLHAQKIQNMDLPRQLSLVYKKQECINNDQRSSVDSRSSPKPSQRDGKSWIHLWVVINCLLAIFFGFIHQGGIYPLTSHVKDIMRRQTKTQVIHLVTSYMYPIPQSLLVLRNSHHKYYDSVTKTNYFVAQKFHAYELGSKSLPDVVDVIKKIMKEAEAKKLEENLDYSVYLALPSTLVEDGFEIQMSNVTFVRESVFYPHMSTEAPPHLKNVHYNLSFCDSENCHSERSTSHMSRSFNTGKVHEEMVQEEADKSLTSQLYHFFRQFSLSLYQVKI